MPIRSMTAFARAERDDDGNHFSCEIKTLNNRYVDLNVRMPRIYNAVEAEIVKLVKSKLQRGKIDVSLSVNLKDREATLAKLNVPALKHYLQIVESIRSEVGEVSLGAYDLLRLEGVLDSENTVDVGKLKESFLGIVGDALESVICERVREGEALKPGLVELLDELEGNRVKIEDSIGVYQKEIYENFKKKLETFKEKFQNRIDVELSEERLATEITLLIDKSDIAEEVERLKTHILDFKNCFEEDNAIGRKLDFLCQEMHREVNTMSSKFLQTEASRITRSMKQTIEQIRQQIQNIE